MKNPKEILAKHYDVDNSVDEHAIVQAMKEYAKIVAKQALINASESAKTVSIPIGMGRHIYSVDEETITDESNIPEL